MSEMRTVDWACPKCSTKCKITIWNSINVDLDPELKDKIFSDELFIWECPECGQKTLVPQNFLYHDMGRKFMLFFNFFDEREKDEKRYATPQHPNESNESNDLPWMEGYTLRSVYGLLNLKEKIFILEHGLNDIAVERQKYMISHLAIPEIAEKGYKLLFGKIDKDATDVSEYGAIYYFYDDEEKKQTVTVRFALDNYYEHCKALEIDPRMKVTGLACIDQGWMDYHLKTSQI